VGLNWSEGLKAGAQGLALMQRSSEQKTDILYKQISQANMQRFQTGQAEADRAWRTEESEKQRTQALSMAETKEAATSKRHKESLAATTELKQAQLDATSAYQTAMTGGKQTVAQQNSYEADLAQINTDYEAAISGADFFDPKAKIPIEADKARKIEAITLRRDNPDGYKRYKSLSKQFTGEKEEQKQKAHEFSLYYGSLDADSANALKSDISARYKAQPEGKKRKAAAIDDAIRAHQAGNDSFTQTGDEAPEVKTPVVPKEPVMPEAVADAGAPMVPNTSRRRGANVPRQPASVSDDAKAKGRFIAQRAEQIARDKGWLNRARVISPTNRKKAEKLALAEWDKMQGKDKFEFIAGSKAPVPAGTAEGLLSQSAS